MIATLIHNSRSYQIDLSKPLDLSIALKGDDSGINAWYLPPAKILPHEDGDFVGSVKMGAAVNFNTIWFNPHAHITHTECVGHITEHVYSINGQLQRFFFLAEVITVAPEKLGNDFVISGKQLAHVLKDKKREAVILRTLPNTREKRNRKYSHTNPPYLSEEAAVLLRKMGVQHLLVDLPSVDKENDQGKLLAHKAFWDIHGEIRMQATITELIYVPNPIRDGTYFLNLQLAPMENDASPSRPIIYKIVQEEEN